MRAVPKHPWSFAVIFSSLAILSLTWAWNHAVSAAEGRAYNYVEVGSMVIPWTVQVAIARHDLEPGRRVVAADLIARDVPYQFLSPDPVRFSDLGSRVKYVPTRLVREGDPLYWADL